MYLDRLTTLGLKNSEDAETLAVSVTLPRPYRRLNTVKFRGSHLTQRMELRFFSPWSMHYLKARSLDADLRNVPPREFLLSGLGISQTKDKFW
jgi:hypothetical protein